MFVLSSTHKKLESKYLVSLKEFQTTQQEFQTTQQELRATQLELQQLRTKYLGLLRQCTELIALENKKRKTDVLTEEQIKGLLKLCHPDRHDNSPESNELTRFLIAKLKQ